MGCRREESTLGQALPHRNTVGSRPEGRRRPRLDAAGPQPADHRLDRNGSLDPGVPAQADRPARPILAVHGNLDERPAALDVAREQEELARARERVARQLAERKTVRAAKEAGRAALSGPGREAVRRALAEATERTRRRREGLDGQASQ